MGIYDRDYMRERPTRWAPSLNTGSYSGGGPKFSGGGRALKIAGLFLVVLVGTLVAVPSILAAAHVSATAPWIPAVAAFLGLLCLIPCREADGFRGFLVFIGCCAVVFGGYLCVMEW